MPYTSADLDDAESELIVPADHLHVHQHPLAVLEIRRILMEHAKEADGGGEIIPVKNFRRTLVFYLMTPSQGAILQTDRCGDPHIS